MKQVQAYSPKCCTGKAFIKPYVCKRHEQNCSKNPDNKACATCEHNVLLGRTVCNNKKCYFCSFYNKEISNSERIGETIYPKMHCESYKNKDGKLV